MTDQELIEWVADMWNQRASGKTFEKRGPLGWMDSAHGPNVDSTPDNWRMKAALKVIDLSPMLESGLDCEFWAAGQRPKKVRGSLKRILTPLSGVLRFYDDNDWSWVGCQPRMSTEQKRFIHYWAGSDKCPVPEGFEVRLYFRGINSGNQYPEPGWTTDWNHTGQGGDIIGIEFTGIKDGYTLGGGNQ
jgi:hypothetical protein